MPGNKRNRPTIGVLAGWQAYSGTLDSFLDNVFRGIQSAAHDRECNLMLACGVGAGRLLGLGRPAWPMHLPEVDFIPVGPWNCDGLIVMPPLAAEAGMSYFRGLVDSGFPLVFAGDANIGPAVIVDNESGIHQALLHLRQHGHRRIAFLAGRVMPVEGDSAIRQRAYLSGVQNYGLDPDPRLIGIGFHTYAGGRQAIELMLKQGIQFSAVLASNDESAFGAIDALRDAGMLVPQDVAVIGFDDRVEARAQVPALTTIHYPMFELGSQAVRLLLSFIEDGIRNDLSVRIATQLVIRASCGCRPGINSFQGNEISRSPDGLASQGLSIPSGIRPEDIQPKPLDYPRLVQVMTRTVNNEMHRLSPDEVGYLCQRLLDAFKASLTQGDPVIFQQTMQQIMERVSTIGDDLYALQAAITMLKDYLPIMQATLPNVLANTQAADLLDQARIAISEVNRWQLSRLLVRQSNVADQINWMTTRFFTARKDEEVFQILSTSLLEIGIEHVAVVFFQPDENDPTGLSVLQTPRLTPGCQVSFPTRQFPPVGLYPDDRPFNLALLPMQIEKNITGYLVLDAANLETCAVILRQLESALKDIRFYQDAVKGRQMAEEGRRLAEEANRLKSRFLSMISHELRTPLNLIFGLSDMLLRESGNNSAQEFMVNRKDLERIYVSARHLDSLIRDVLDLARSDIGQLKLVCEPLNLGEVLDEVAVIGEQLAFDKELSWKMEIQPDLPCVWGDRTRLRQVSLNLVNNAVKFTARGEVVLIASAKAGQVTVSVRDTGLGIPPEEQVVIFDEFRQSERTTERGFGGLGLGLAICKRLIEMHAGKIGVSSSGEEGQGSTFYFSLPVYESQQKLAQPPVSLEQLHQVLLLVKDLHSGNLLKDHLVHQGFEVKVQRVNTEADWLARLLFEPPDAVILDLGLTSEYGWEIIKILKEHPATHDIPVLFYSLENSTDSGSLLEIGFMTKPAGTGELAETLLAQGLLSASANQGRDKKILIVDDDPGILALYTRIIETQLPAYRVLCAQNGREAMKLILQEHPELVLLDLIMPEMDGFTVLEKMRADDLSRNIPVIVLTGQQLTAEDMERLNFGVASVLGKGMFSVAETLEHVTASLLHKRKPGSETQRMVLKSMAFIHSHYADPISRSEIARHVGVSERHLTRCFHQEVGITPITYLNRYRVRQAKNLLDSGRNNMTEIGADVGFSSSAYFTRVFSEEVGMSPRAYQQNKGS